MGNIFDAVNVGGGAGGKGEPGDPGPANVLTIGTVETLAPGTPATAEITGDSPNQVLSLGIPQGDKGEPGEGGGSELATLGAVGSYALMSLETLPDSKDFRAIPGATFDGANLRYAGAAGHVSSSPVPTGTWRCHGYVSVVGDVSLFYRTA